MKKPPHTLLIGFGDLARRLAAHLPGPVTALRRSAQPYCVQGDATDPKVMRQLLSTDIDQIVMTLTPSQYSDEGYRQAYVEPVQVLVDALTTAALSPRVVFVSSTSVYGQNQGQWVDENSVTEPTAYSGRRLLEAEQLLLSAGLSAVCARLSGLYGPGRGQLLEQIRSGQKIARNLLAFSNRIHVDDAASALAHVLALDNPASHYLVSDSAPVLLAEVVRGLATRLGQSVPDQSEGGLFAGKRVSNRRLLDSGFELQYPSWREGYAAQLEAIVK